ncbi:MAG: excinuclease ABC subunit B [Deltaproteobacteria bacterium RBG_13_43_22]|nr:MAG: excinuclease ABC subunit B [Deltaproteobacteria bacterium RBG_13_43_22]
MNQRFKLRAEFTPKGDQPQAIKQLVQGVIQRLPHQVLLGVTGSGKTFTMAQVVDQVQKPTLVLAPNKTLAAQLFGEFKSFFPENAVEYFVSYYDYYQPEAYLPQTDTYIAKDSSINEAIDKMRHSATRSLLTRNDCLIVASVSCIYGLGSPEAYQGMLLSLKKNQEIPREEILSRLVTMLYERNDMDFHRGTFRVRGDVVEVFPAYEEDQALRITFFGDSIETLSMIDPLRGKITGRLEQAHIFPNSHYVTPEPLMELAFQAIEAELEERIDSFRSRDKLIEAQRIEERTRFDLEMMKELGYCHGIENYSRHLTGRRPGQPPPTLLEYFPKDFLLFIDESHLAVPQLQGMYRGDQSRKQTLVDYGFRLPSALDNRPLNFKEFENLVHQVIYVSATPAEYELTQSGGLVAEQIIRPTGLMDPQIQVFPADNQVEHLKKEIEKRVLRRERILVTTLTKRLAENLTEYYQELGIKVRYLHSDIDTLERIEILRDLRLGAFDCLVGINLLREGLDLPEVSLVAILDADKEGFLRSARSLIQTCGRASRNIFGQVYFYANQVTRSMKEAIQETEKRRAIQTAYNKKHKITPTSIKKSIQDILSSVYEADYVTVPIAKEKQMEFAEPQQIPMLIKQLRKRMKDAAARLDFEEAVELRDRIKVLQEEELLWK